MLPVPVVSDTLSEAGKNPVKQVVPSQLYKIQADVFGQAIVVTLPTIESSFVNHVGKGIQGISHPDYPALRVASEVLSATESFLWVRN